MLLNVVSNPRPVTCQGFHVLENLKPMRTAGSCRWREEGDQWWGLCGKRGPAMLSDTSGVPQDLFHLLAPSLRRPTLLHSLLRSPTHAHPVHSLPSSLLLSLLVFPLFAQPETLPSPFFRSSCHSLLSILLSSSPERSPTSFPPVND